MRFVVNTNWIVAALIKDSSSRKIILHGNAELLAIRLYDNEIEKYKSEILQKTHISEEQFHLVYAKLNEKLVFLPDNAILEEMEEGKKIMDAIDKSDTPFIATALATKTAIWSDDKHFEKQNKIGIYKTKDLLEC